MGYYGNMKILIHCNNGLQESISTRSLITEMYVQWAKNNGLEMKMERSTETSILFYLEGNHPQLLNENGTHRVVRISPFDEHKRRWTTFIGVVVTDDDTEPQPSESIIDNQVRTYAFLDEQSFINDYKGGNSLSGPDLLHEVVVNGKLELVWNKIA
jgi:protein subunit release factor B